MDVTTLTGCRKTNISKVELNKPVVTLGSDSYPPYNYLNEDGIPTGIDVELATEAFRRMGYQVEVIQINWEKKKELVESGEIDCIMGCFSMEGAFQKRIFEPFAQEHAGSRTKFAGTGLGMPITKKLIEKMGGTITFESEKGVGTTFMIQIPFRIDTEADTRIKQEERSKASIQGLHILLVEDNDLNMEIAEFVLENEGAIVIKAENGKEAVDIFQSSGIGECDAILMDIMMPVMDGLTASRIIRAMDRLDARTIPIIAMTANAFTEDKIKAKEAGMDEHIAKPLDRRVLVEVVARLINKEKKHREGVRTDEADCHM